MEYARARRRRLVAYVETQLVKATSDHIGKRLPQLIAPGVPQHGDDRTQQPQFPQRTKLRSMIIQEHRTVTADQNRDRVLREQRSMSLQWIFRVTNRRDEEPDGNDVTHDLA